MKYQKEGESWESIQKDFESIIVPNLLHWQHPNFFGFFPANVSFPSILGELLSAGLGVQGMIWLTSPACTELEIVVLDWLGRLLNLPKEFLSENGGGGVIQGTASESTLVALVAARYRIINQLKLDETDINSKLVVYVSDQTHSSATKACMIAGINNLRILPANKKTLSLEPDVLKSAIQEDREKGLIPFYFVATVGTTSTCAFDPLDELGEICIKENIWMHVDAAFAGSAAICPEYRYLLNGVEKADSFNFNPHKWLLVNFDCSAFWVKDRNVLINSLSITPEYLRNKASESGEVIDFRDWQIPLGRRFRSLKLWFVLRTYGQNKLRDFIRNHIKMAEKLESWIKEDDRFIIAYPRVLSLITLKTKEGNEKTKTLYERINNSRKYIVTHTMIDGEFILRICVGSANTKLEHVENLWKFILEIMKEI